LAAKTGSCSMLKPTPILIDILIVYTSLYKGSIILYVRGLKLYHN
jgi:hypothetical protein